MEPFSMAAKDYGGSKNKFIKALGSLLVSALCSEMCHTGYGHHVDLTLQWVNRLTTDSSRFGAQEFASGAQKYQRTEIKNAMKKERRQPIRQLIGVNALKQVI